MPRVSVVLAVHNGERYLREAIDSILHQRFGDFEFLIVDDGSTDASGAIVRSYSDARIRLLESPSNLGLTRSLNQALAAARGHYIARQDADDISEPDRLEQQVAFLDRHAHVALLGTSFRLIDPNGTIVARVPLPVDDIDLRWEMFFSCPFVHGSVMWRHALVRDHVGAYNESFAYAQDNELWFRIASRFAVANLGAFLVRYRDHPNSMTMTYGDRTQEAHQLWCAAVGEALGWDLVSRENRLRFSAMVALLDGSRPTDLTAGQAARAVQDVLALESVFCRRHGIHGAAASRHRRAVCASIGSGLVRLSRHCTDRGRTSDARAMLRAAFSVHRPAVAGRSAVRVAARLLGARFLTRIR
jgi:hypothetical protein